MFMQQGFSDVAELLKLCRVLGASGVPCHLPATCIIHCLNLEAAELMYRQLLTLRSRGKKGTARHKTNVNSGCLLFRPGSI